MREIDGRRRARVDPEDSVSVLVELHRRARIDGRGVFLEVLADQESWARASIEVQDLAVAEVCRRLGSAYELRGSRSYDCGGRRFRIAGFLHKATGARLKLVPGGALALNSGVASSETCTVAPFLIGAAPVTRSVWAQRESRSPELPMTGVDWHQTCAWLEGSGDGLRLPDRVEWEYACRAGSESAYCFGDDPAELERYAWYRGNTTGPQNFVGLKAANAFGLRDVHGLVMEWCHLSRLPPQLDQAFEGTHCVLGGHWSADPEECRASHERFASEDESDDTIGFRLARSI